jgi:hypothetical protein
VAEQKIDGIEFRCVPPTDAEAVFELGLRAGVIMGPALAKLGGLGSLLKDVAADPKQVKAVTLSPEFIERASQALGEAMPTLDPKAATALVKELAQMTQIKHEGRFEDTIVGVHITKPGQMLKVAIFAGGVVLRDFF